MRFIRCDVCNAEVDTSAMLAVCVTVGGNVLALPMKHDVRPNHIETCSPECVGKALRALADNVARLLAAKPSAW